MAELEPEIETGHPCPYCGQNTLTLSDRPAKLPGFGVIHVFGMTCERDECGFHVSDVEAEDDRKPVKETFEVQSEDDLRVRVVKSSSGTVKVPRMVEIKGGDESSGYVTNIEGLLNRIKEVVEELAQDDDKDVAKKAKNHLKKIQRVLWGRESLKITIEDPTGNSGFVRDAGDPE